MLRRDCSKGVWVKLFGAKPIRPGEARKSRAPEDGYGGQVRHGYSQGRTRLFDSGHGDDDLADLRVRLHVAVSVDDFGQREGLVDARFEVAGREMVEDVLFGFRKCHGIDNKFEEGVPLDSEVLAEDRKQRKRRGLGGECAVFEDNAAARRSRRERFEPFATDGVEDNARAFAGCNLVDASDEILLFRSDDVVRAERDEFGFSCARCGWWRC